ncbi:hypothetical protein [Pyxidicoccus xibeiensis]|uniref:hypothetical protein n=1 Tax=Pyxidicoccus xibeiensis TaxID=2906759 RepID=UPI0020A77F89|nr:hypothetical protein [Pyxidicoccus xibeiensis]MCP3143827.1 hypothetical protein [Pyxidicoccus xibeiensis]
MSTPSSAPVQGAAPLEVPADTPGRSAPEGPPAGVAARARSVLLAVLWAVLGFTLLKGLVTVPHDWAISHHLLNYSHGFVKRGLPGTLLLPFFAEKDGATVRHIIIGVSFAAMTLFTLWAASATRALLRGRAADGGPERDDVAVAFLFASSAFVWHTGMCLGYFDSLLAVLSLLAVRGGRLSLAWFVPIAAVTMLVHETASVVLVPVLLLAALDPSRPGLAVDRRTAARVLAVLVALALLACFIFLSPPSDALHARMLQWGATPSRWVDIVHELLRVSFRQNVRRIFEHEDLWRIYARGLLVFLPTTFVMMALGLARLWRSGLERRARWTWAAVYAVASCSSLVLVLIAFDFARLFSLTHLQAFLAYTALRGQLERQPGAAPVTAGRAWGLPALAAVLVVANLLMPARFTFMAPMPRFLPAGVEPWLVDPLGSLADRVLRQ